MLARRNRLKIKYSEEIKFRDYLISVYNAGFDGR